MVKQHETPEYLSTTRILGLVYHEDFMVEVLGIYMTNKKNPHEKCVEAARNRLLDYLKKNVDPDIEKKIKIEELNPMLEEMVNAVVSAQNKNPLFKNTISKSAASGADVQGIKNQYYNTFLDIGGSLSPKDREAFLGSIDKIVVNIDSAMKSKQHDGAEPTVTTHTTSKKVPPPPQHKGSHTGTLGTKPNPAHAGQRDPGAKHTDLAAKGSSAKTQR